MMMAVFLMTALAALPLTGWAQAQDGDSPPVEEAEGAFTVSDLVLEITGTTELTPAEALSVAEQVYGLAERTGVVRADDDGLRSPSAVSLILLSVFSVCAVVANFFRAKQIPGWLGIIARAVNVLGLNFSARAGQ